MNPEWSQYFRERDYAMAELQCNHIRNAELAEIAQIAEVILEGGGAPRAGTRPPPSADR